MDTTNRTADSPPPGPSPVFPGLPTTTVKNVTRIIAAASLIVGMLGTWYAKEEEIDPETTQVIATRVNVPGLVASATGILGFVGAMFQAKQQADQAHVAVAVAAASPPVDPNGKTSVKHTLNTALTQASQGLDFDTATEILNLLKKLKDDVQAQHLENVA